MAEDSSKIAAITHLKLDDLIISLSVAVIAVPFITGVFLLILRGFEIKNNKKYSEKFTGTVGVGGLVISWALSLQVMFMYFSKYVKLSAHPEIGKVQSDYNFLPNAGAPLKWGILLDPLSIVFLVLLTTIATVIHLYASEYMHADPAYTRFFGTLNFFTGSMLGFVLASNLFMGFIFWELLGFSSYLLIGFYWQKPSASSAAKKAFLYNKVGDISFMVGIALIFSKTLELMKEGIIGEATLDYYELAKLIEEGELKFFDLAIPALLIFGAAIGKSAQFPLFGWLPEAMEGPTPVSALLHSSTMVKAGLYLIARNFFLFYRVEGTEVLFETDIALGIKEINFSIVNIVTWIGVITALAGGLIALTSGDIKKVLAFSTISQLGYIGLAIGAGGLTPGFFHLISHATFKSLLFLAAGAVIHSVHSQEMKNMGGLRKYMPWTFWTMTIGLAGLSGVVFMNGFWSKDAVLLALKSNEQIFMGELAYFIAVFTAGVTAFYSTKLWILTFFGEGRYDRDHVHPAPTGIRMRIALVILASLVVIESIWWTLGSLVPALRDNDKAYWNFEYALGSLLSAHGGEFAWSDAFLSILFVALGIILAILVYHVKLPALLSFKASGFMTSLEKIVANRFGLDILFYWIVESPVMKIGDQFQNFDKNFIDGIIVDSLVGEGSLKVATASDNFDRNVIDFTVDWVGNRTRDGGYALRNLQKGRTPVYARLMSAGLAVVLLILTYFTIII